jgi:hypothetical protein
MARQYGSQSWVDSRVVVGDTLDKGKGMFACQPITIGEIVIVWGGKLFSQEDIDSRRFKPHTAAAIAEGVYLAGDVGDEDLPDEFTNHSCDPNLWMMDEVTISARRNIDAGEELTADYAMWEGDERWIAQWECRCGSRLCRKVITGKDWRLPDLQRRYKGHFSPFMNQRIAHLTGD